METASNRFIWHLKLRPSLSPASVSLRHSLLREIKCAGSRVSLEVCSGAIAFDRITPLWYLPLKLNFRLHCCFWQIDLHAVARSFYVTDIDLAGKCGGPETSDWPTTGVECKVFLIARFILVVPPRRHNPRVIVVEVSLLRTRYRRLVPGMTSIDRVT